MRNLKIDDTAIYIDAATGDKTPVVITKVTAKFGGDVLDFVSITDPDDTYEGIFESAVFPAQVIRNRYGDYYWWEPLGDNKYAFNMTGNSLEYCRSGGREGVSGIDDDNLGMFDPSGGPYIELGSRVKGKRVNRIQHTPKGYVVTVGDE